MLNTKYLFCNSEYKKYVIIIEENISEASIDKSTYKSDVHTAFVCGMMKYKSLVESTAS